MLVEPDIDFSQYGQPRFIRRFIPPEAPRWVVDVGAHDGIEGSNSRGFVIDGWSVLLIEPLPEVFAALKANSHGWSKVRLEQCACSESEGVAVFHIGLDGPNGQTSSLCQDDVWKDQYNGQQIQVKLRTLTSLLTDHQCPRDPAVLLIDAEGMDFEVLCGLDFSIFRLFVICTEMYRANPAKDFRKAELLKSNGYRLRAIVGSDVIWTSTDFGNAESDSLFYGYSLPKDIADMKVTAGVGYFDRTQYSEGMLMVSGWAIAPDQTIPGIVLLGLKTKDGVLWRQSARHPRADVARHFQKQALLYSGFVASFPLQPGEQQVSVTAIQTSHGLRWDNEGVLPVLAV